MSTTSKNVLYNILSVAIQYLFPIITLPYASRILGVSNLGLINYFDSYIRWFILVSLIGLPLFSNNLKIRSKIFFQIQTLHIITMVCTLILYIIYFSGISRSNIDKELYILGGLVIFFNCFSFEWFYAGISDFSFVTKRLLIVRVISLLLLFVFVRNENDKFSYYALTVSNFFFSALINIFYIKRKVM